MLTNKVIFKIILLALVCRGIYFVVAFKTDILKSPGQSISVVYQRAAYLYAWGYGYSQTLPGSEAYQDLNKNKEAVYQGLKITHPVISPNGLYPTSHYPPGWPLTGAFLYKIFGFPVLESMIVLSILFDLIALYFLIKLLSNFFSLQLVLWSAILYSIFPPILYLQVNGSADSFMPGFIILMAYLFYYSENLKARKKFGVWILIGLLTGVSALYRSDYFLFPFFLSFLLLTRSLKFMPFFKYNFTIGIVAVLVLLPWAIRNKELTGKMNFTSTSLGGTLVTGLATFPNPWKLGPSDYDREAEALKAGITTPFEANGDQFFRKQYEIYVSQNPGYFFKAIIYRTFYFFLAPYDWGFKKDKSFAFVDIRNKGNILSSIGIIIKEKFFNFISVGFSLISFFSLFVLLLKPSYNKKFRNFCLITVGYVYLSHVFIHMTANYTLPIISIQIPLFILGILFLFSRKKYETAIHPASKG